MQRHEHWQHLSRNSIRTPRPPIAIAGPVILDCTDVYSRQKTPMYIKVKSQSGTNDGCQIRRHIMG